jgi:RHS repeat-associated protein
MTRGKMRKSICPRRPNAQRLCAITSLLSGVLVLFAPVAARAQSYLAASGTPTFVAPEPVEQGFTDNANGNLHLEFGFGSYPQRATSQLLPVKYVYDSNMVWNIGCNTSCNWAPSNYNSYGWRLSTNTGTLSGTNCGTQCTEWIFTDSAGTSRYFPVSTGTCPVPNSYASDSSGYMLNLCQTGIYAPDGSLVYSATYEQTASPGAEDSNGNYAPWGTGDTLGRTLPTSTFNCNGNTTQTCYGVPNSQGGISTYTITIATINVRTAFGQSGVSEFSGTMNVVQSIALPDGTSYSFKFDCDSSTNVACGSPSGQSAYYGLLTSMTFPTGGVVSYGWTTFSDSYSNKTRWLNSRQSAGGLWSYSPQVISTCSSTQVGCQQKVTVSKPSGDSSVYTFTLNNGAWPVQIQTYDSSSNLLATVNNTYDFSQACPFTNCHGAAYIRLLTAQTTVSTPTGSITKQSQYQYDSPQTGNITAKKEWGYYTGTSPSFPSVPDRATYTTYLSTGTNDINRPLSVTLCNNSGSDSACPGGGSRVQQTLNTYDSYSGCPSGLAVVSGVMNHDDTNFGGGYTTRGNATQVQNWVSGSTYLTTQLCYDTTGQVTQQADPKGNVTTYSYTDQFYSDNGTNSLTSYTPSKPTNAYATSITQALVGTTSTGYYYGSGKTAFSTDPNGATSYSHFMDAFDRSTENDYALTGWDKTVYTSATQTDVYFAVGDTTPSSTCQSCQHKQLLLDSYARRVSEKLANYPGGAASVDTGYDGNGRVSTVSHPYQGSSGQVYEYYYYDGLDRTKQNSHPDNQYVMATWGAGVSSAGGVSSQQGSPTTYGYGYPVLILDEAGKQKQEWLDGFGRIIEVDEAATTAATPGHGSVSTSGSEQSIGGSPATSGSGSVTISGSEQSVQVCTQHLAGGDCGRYTTRYDHGTVSITVNGVVSSVSYSQGSTSSSITTGLASAINSNSGINSLVSASASGSTVTITAKQTGSQTNYSLSAAAVSGDTTDFPDGSFYTTASGATLTGGNNAVGATYDYGTISVTVNGSQYSVSYGQNSTPSSLASALAQAINGSSSPPVTASANGSVVSLTSVTTGAATNYSLSATSSTSDPSQFSSPSFTAAPSGSTLTGGAGSGSSLVTPVVTLYTYDAGDRLTQVVQAVQTRTFVYDGLGRPTSISTPEAGTETLAYTVSGALCSGAPDNACQKTDARGVVTTYSYDSLNRLVGKSYTIPQGSNVAAMPNVCTTSTSQSANTCYFYDQGGASAFALGRRTQMVDPSGSESYAYDKAGRITQVAKLIGTTSYLTGYQYNAGDGLTQATYPSGRVVQLGYDVIGHVCEIAPSTSGCGTSGSPYATAYAYNPSGQLTGFNYGNGVSASYSYSPNRSQLTSLSYVKGTQTLFKLNYFYNLDSTNCPNGAPGNDGQIQCVTDSVDSGRTANYTYDALGRLNAAITNGSTGYPQWGLSWTYDRYGNRLSQTVTAGSGYTSSLSFANPGGAQTNRPDGWCFDASGNLLAKSGTCPPPAPNFVYDGENRMVADPTAGATYVYDGNGTRVQKCLPNCTSPTSSTVFIFSGSQDIAEYDNGTAPASPSREFIYSDPIPGSGLVATITGGASPTVTYFHDDHLSWRVSTDGTAGSPTYGQVNGQQGNYPFGESWYSSNGNEFVFTTYQRDSESSLDYAMARYYDSGAARFCSADPLGGQLDDPQTWDRYTYARNDPVDLIDPNGKGFFSWLMDALLILADIFTGGATTPESVEWGISMQGIQDLATVAALAHEGMENSPQGQKQQPQQQTPQGQGRVNCGNWNVSMTVVGGRQARRKGAFTNKPVNVGDVAVDPTDFGYDDYYDLAGQINPAKGHPDTPQYPNSQKSLKQIGQDQRELKNAHITITPTSPLPSGMPSQGPYSGVDAINPPHDNGVDVYRTQTKQQARKLGRIPATVTASYDPSGKVHCPN